MDRIGRRKARRTRLVLEPLEPRSLLSGFAVGGTIRFATFNASLNRGTDGQLVTDLSAPGNAQAATVAEIIQRTRPDVLLINEFDYVPAGLATSLFQQNYLDVSQNGAGAIHYDYAYSAPSNTGIASGFDLNNNGAIVTTPGAPGYGDDAFGFGNFPGQFGMALFSRYPIVEDDIRTFQNFLWKDMPGALLPDDASTPEPDDWYSGEELEVFRLSSKSHWDVPIDVEGQIVHVLASHPTPPVFDGPEDRNGRRNHDEIRFWADYVTPGQSGYIYDDSGEVGGVDPNASYVLMGDMNADPFDGDSVNFAIRQLLDSPRFNTLVTPLSLGGPDAADRQGGANLAHLGDPAFDTADFSDFSPGNLRADYVLPSADLSIRDAEVFWPRDEDPLFPLVGNFTPGLPGGFPSSDHRLVYVDLAAPTPRQTVGGLEFLGEATFATGTVVEGTTLGGLSGIVRDPSSGLFYAISDDRSQFNPARFYTLSIDLADGSLDPGDVDFLNVTYLLQADGTTYPPLSIDPEGIALAADGTLYISSEGDANAGIAPFVNRYGLDGSFLEALPVPAKFLPAPTTGIRNNLAFESLTVTPGGQTLFTATENSLKQDGPAAGVDTESASRVIRYDLITGQPVAEYAYITDAVAETPIPAGSFSTNGLVELLALDDQGTLLALERSFSNGVGNAIRLYEVRTSGAVDIAGVDGLDGFEADPAVSKRLVLDFADLGLTLDNIEGISFGPTLADGRRTLVVVSDNNFSATQFTQFLAFAVDLKTIPSVYPSAETPDVIDDEDLAGTRTFGDADDPAIWVHPTDSSQSTIITALKDGGLQVYDLQGQVLQTITGLKNQNIDIRFNNVDIVYGFTLNAGRTADLAIVSDRENDSLVIFEIDPTSRTLSEITGRINDKQPIFEGDTEATAYGLTAFTSPATGKSYAFVTQADGNRIAQLELTRQGGKVNATIVRELFLPIPDGGELEDAQAEAMVVDRELGFLYIAQENVGIWKFLAEPTAGSTGALIHTVIDDEATDGTGLKADAEGLTIYYGAAGQGYLLASSQGDDTFAVYGRQGDNPYLGSFAVVARGGIDSANETDGADVINVALGPDYPFGLLVVQDGSNDPQQFLNDDGELENINGNFKLVPWQAVANAFPTPLAIDTTSYDPRVGVSSLIAGLASGDTTSTSTILWAKTQYAADIEFQLATDPGFRTIVATASGGVADPSVPFKAAVHGLTPRTRYYVRALIAGASTDAVGTFQTAAGPASYSGLRFGVSGDWRGELAPYPGVANADDANLDLFIELGDTIYADFPSPDLPLDQAVTLDDYRVKQNEVYSERLGLNTLGDLRASTSILATIDDHEVINDFAGGAPIGSDPRFLGDPADLINDSELYENGLQAFVEYNPIAETFYGDTGDPRTAGERSLYRASSQGLDASIFVLDARSFRDPGLPSIADPTDPAQIGAFLAASFNPARTMLGRTQIDELKADLLDAQARGVTWKFIVVAEPIQNLGVVGASDRFEGYAAERTELLHFIETNAIDNAVFLAADIHGTLVNNLTYQLSPFGPQIATSAFEITTGSVAFDAPFGPTVVDLAGAVGLLTPQQRAFYDSLPVANDPDSIPNDKDDFLKLLVDQQVTALGYDPLGLNQNLPQAAGLIDAQLLQGDYVATHTFGWTQVEIAPQSQQLTITTYGIEPYTQAELEADPAAILGRMPTIVSQFTVNPKLDARARLIGDTLVVNGTAGNDSISAVDEAKNGQVVVRANGQVVGSFAAASFRNLAMYGFAGNDYLQLGNTVTAAGFLRGGLGNDHLIGGRAADILLGESGNDLLSGNGGRDLLIGGEGTETIIADADDDILIGGSTVYDNHDEALREIVADWNASGSYTTRIASLRSRLNRLTIFDDLTADYYFGGSGLDWFLTGTRDVLNDRVSNEQRG